MPAVIPVGNATVVENTMGEPAASPFTGHDTTPGDAIEIVTVDTCVTAANKVANVVRETVVPLQSCQPAGALSPAKIATVPDGVDDAAAIAA